MGVYIKVFSYIENVLCFSTIYILFFLYCEIAFRFVYIVFTLKGWFTQKVTILSLITQPQVVPNPKDLCSYSEHKLIFLMNSESSLTLLRQLFHRCLRSVESACMLNINTADYVLGYSPKWQRMLTWGEEPLNKLCCFLCVQKVFS